MSNSKILQILWIVAMTRIVVILMTNATNIQHVVFIFQGWLMVLNPLQVLLMSTHDDRYHVVDKMKMKCSIVDIDPFQGHYVSEV